MPILNALIRKLLLMKQTLVLLLSVVFLCQCNSVRVTGSAPSTPISKLVIVKNDKLHMDGLQPEVVKQVQAMGITTELVDTPPSGNAYYLTFTANWSWDLAMYLRYFKADLHQGPVVLGTVEYNTSGADMNKFGHTENKIRPLLKQLIRGEKPVPAKR